MERAVILSGGTQIEPEYLPEHLLQPASPGAGPSAGTSDGRTAAEAEKELILSTLNATGNNKAEAARRLGLDVKTIRNKLKTYGVS